MKFTIAWLLVTIFAVAVLGHALGLPGAPTAPRLGARIVREADPKKANPQGGVFISRVVREADPGFPTVIRPGHIVIQWPTH